MVNGATQEGRDVARDLIIFEPIEPHWRTGRTSVLPKLAFVDPAWALGLLVPSLVVDILRLYY